MGILKKKKKANITPVIRDVCYYINNNAMFI